MLLEISDLTKLYGRTVRANDGISLSVESGQLVGLLGHNGAGKTTLLSQVIGLARPTSGKIRVSGIDAVKDPVSARRLCSLQLQAQTPLEGLNPHQAIETMARIRGASRRRARERTSYLLSALQIEEWATTPAERLSGGVRRLTAFCIAAVEPGKLVMLDEPTNDVDPVRRKLLWGLVRELAEAGCGVVLVTHNVAEAERAVQRLIILDHGKVVAHGTPAELRGSYRDEFRLDLVAADATTAISLAGEFTGTEPATVTGSRLTMPIAYESAGAALHWAQQERRAGRVEEFSIAPMSLEDVYVKLVGVEDNQDLNTQEADSASLAS